MRLVDEPISKDDQINECVDKYLKNMKERSKEQLDSLDIIIIKFQIHLLTALNNHEQNVLHIACINGSHLIHFLMDMADELGCRNIIVQSRGPQGRSPIFFLC